MTTNTKNSVGGVQVIFQGLKKGAVFSIPSIYLNPTLSKFDRTMARRGF